MGRESAIQDLYHAVCNRDVDAARAALKSGVDPNARIPGEPPLLLVGFAGMPSGDLLDLLLEAGADPLMAVDDDGRTVMHFCANQGRIEDLARFHWMGCDPHQAADDGHTPLEGADPAAFEWLINRTDVPQVVLNRAMHRAIADFDLHRLKRLLNTGADPNAPSPVGMHPLFSGFGYGPGGYYLEALLNAGADAVKARGIRGMTAMHAAAARGSDAELDRLAELGCDPMVADDDGKRPADFATGEALFWFQRSGLLLSEKAGERILIAALKDQDQWLEAIAGGARATPHVLFCAVDRRDPGSVERVLDTAPHLAQGPKGNPILHYAAMYRLHKICQLLLASGADPDDPGRDGQRALHCVMAHGLSSNNKRRKDEKRKIPSIVKLLLAHGAAPLLPDDAGRTPYAAALEAGMDSSVLSLLPKKGNEDTHAHGIRDITLYQSGDIYDRHFILYYPHRRKKPFEIGSGNFHPRGGGFGNSKFVEADSVLDHLQHIDLSLNDVWLVSLFKAWLAGEVSNYTELAAFAKASRAIGFC